MDAIPVDYDLGTARGRIEIDASDLGRSSTALTRIGKEFLLVGAAGVAAFGYVVKSAATFEKQMDAVEAVTNGTKTQMKALSEQALTLASNSVYSATEIGGAMEALGKAGITVEEMMGGATQATVTLAAAAGDELPGGVDRAAEVIANAMKTFGAGADEMDHFADVLVGAAASSTVSVEDMATSFRYAAPIASALGLSIDDLSTVLAILGDRGIKGSTAGTSLRGVLLSLTPTSKKAADTMKELGIITEDGSNKFYDMAGNLKPIPEVMQILGDATKDLSEQQKVQAFNSIFQRRAMNAAMIMAELGADGFMEYADAIAAIDADDVAATKLDNLSGDLKILRNSVDALIIRAGMPLQDMLRGWVQGLTGIVEWLQKLDDETLANIVKIIGITGVIFGAIGAFAIFIGMVLKLYRVYKDLAYALKLVTAAQKLLSASFLLNPVVLFIAALVAIGAALYLAYKRSDAFREAFDKAFDKIQPTIEAIVGWVQNFVSYLDELWAAFQEGGIEGNAFSTILDKMGLNAEMVVGALVWLRDAFIWMKNAAVTAFDYFADEVLPLLLEIGWAIIQGIGTAIDWFTTTAVPAIRDFATAFGETASDVIAWIDEHIVPAFVAFGEMVAGAVEYVIEVWNNLWPAIDLVGQIIWAILRFIASLFDDFVAKVLQVWNYLGDNLWRYVQTIWDLIVQVFQGAFQIIRGIFNIFTAILTGDWGLAWEGIKNIVAGAWRIIASVVTTALELIWLAIQTILDVIVLVFKTAWDVVGAVVEAAWNFIFGIISGVIGWIVGLIQGFFDWLIFGSIWTDAWNKCVEVLQNAWNSITSALSTAITTISGWIAALPGNIVAWLGDVGSTLYQKGIDLINGFMNGIIFIVGELVSYLWDLPGNIVEWLGDLGETLYNAGVDLVQGFIDGIDNMIPSVGDVLGGLTDMIPDWKGPPETDKVLLRDNGRLIMEGFMRGLESQFPAVKALLQGYSNQLSASMTMNGAAGMLGPGPSTESFVFNIEISGSDPEGIKEQLQDPDLLEEIVRATRAGRR